MYPGLTKSNEKFCNGNILEIQFIKIFSDNNKVDYTS